MYFVSAVNPTQPGLGILNTLFFFYNLQAFRIHNPEVKPGDAECMFQRTFYIVLYRSAPVIVLAALKPLLIGLLGATVHKVKILPYVSYGQCCQSGFLEVMTICQFG